MRFDLSTKVRCVSELVSRHSNLDCHEDLRSITADWVDEESLPWTAQRNLHLNTAEQEPGNSEITQGEGTVDVRVMLMRLPKVATRFMTHNIQLIMKKPGGNRNSFFGGFVDPETDGEDTTNLTTLINAATRHVKAQTSMDLSSLSPSAWIRFATFNSSNATSVYLIPKLWEIDSVFEASQQSWNETKSETKEIEKEVEEEVEEQVPAEEEGGEPTTVTKTVKKTVKETVTVDNTTIQQFAAPVKVSLKRLLENTKIDNWQQGFIGEMLQEWISVSAGNEITKGLTQLSSKLQREAEKKRLKEENERTRNEIKRRKLGERETEMKEMLQSMTTAWEEDDLGHTEDEIAEAEESRKKEKEEKIKEMKEEWAAQDEAAEAQDRQENEDMDVDEQQSTIVNEPLLTSFSMFDQGLRTFGGVPREDVPADTMKQLLMASGPISQLAAQALLPPGQKLRYRTITDEEEA